MLVILGLLVGGVLSGQALIRAAELRSITTDVNRYITAMASFRDKYFALPGDLTNATSFWGTDPGGCPIAPYNTVPKKETCNGDGDGKINGTTAAYPNGFYNYEVHRSWQHQADAGLINGQYTGTCGTSNYGGVCTSGASTLQVGLDIPASKITPAGFTLMYLEGVYSWNDFTVDTGWFFHGNYGNILEFGHIANGAHFTYGPVLTPEELWNIDTKTDDGKPATGKIIAMSLLSFCVTTTSSATAEYDLANTNAIAYGVSHVVCTPLFLTGL